MAGLASGKVILLGEHAVVYGTPALVVGIDRGATASATLAGANEVGASALALGGHLRVTASDGTEVARAFAALLEACDVRCAVRVTVATELPAGAGLGCSAAVGVAIVRALDRALCRPPAPAHEVIARAMAWEHIFHGNPSGIDATAAARGGCLWYQRTASGPLFQELRLGGTLTLAVGHSGIASSTRAMVEHVAKLRERDVNGVTAAFATVSSLVHAAKLALEEHDLAALGRAMNDNQSILSALLLSTQEIDDMCQLARAAGALGAKLTGSGGGGCVVALLDDDARPVLDVWAAAGYRAFSTRVVPEVSAPRERHESP